MFSAKWDELRRAEMSIDEDHCLVFVVQKGLLKDAKTTIFPGVLKCGDYKDIAKAARVVDRRSNTDDYVSRVLATLVKVLLYNVPST